MMFLIQLPLTTISIKINSHHNYILSSIDANSDMDTNDADNSFGNDDKCDYINIQINGEILLYILFTKWSDLNYSVKTK